MRQRGRVIVTYSETIDDGIPDLFTSVAKDQVIGLPSSWNGKPERAKIAQGSFA